ncbi:MFS transporter [Cryptosporangium phraense]|uniref:MFS transporter n=1 Tax=Cryptosporangium phraense TaxID=2593070 RepID=A0A545AXC6_9ACTN|nr:MFS transporter [Cryptosporangium phraense]TQS45974.1 MFS transporter [Cryptosporangium phraense]
MSAQVLFFLNGAVFGTWAARIPDVSARVGASHSALGTALFCVSLGALVSMVLAGRWCARFGAGRVAALASAGAAGSLIAPGLCTSVTGLCVALVLFGAATGAANVAANSLGVHLGRLRSRPVMSALHAGFSFGGLTGAAIGGLAGAVPVPLHFAAVAAIGAAALATITPALRATDRSAAPTDAPGRADGGRVRGAEGGGRGAVALIVVLGAVAGCTAFAEGALSDWGALHLRETLGADPATAATGYAAFCLAMGCGRALGARWIVRYGDARILILGTLAAAIGATAAAYTLSVPIAIGGFVLVGLGLANVFPLVIGRAGLLGGPRGVALASTVGYSGLLGGPPAIGFLAAHAGLPAALSTITALALVATVLSAVVAVELPDSTTVAAALRARARRATTTAVADLALLTDPTDHATTDRASTDHASAERASADGARVGRPLARPVPAGAAAAAALRGPADASASGRGGAIRPHPGLEFLVPDPYGGTA